MASIIVEDTLKEVGLKVTGARIMVLKLLTASHKPLSVEEVFTKLKRQSPDRVTMYRVLRDLVETELVREVDFKEGFVRYEYQGSHHHHHIVCKECGTYEHIHDKGLERLLQKVGETSKLFKGKIEHALEFFSICKKCTK